MRQEDLTSVLFFAKVTLQPMQHIVDALPSNPNFQLLPTYKKMYQLVQARCAAHASATGDSNHEDRRECQVDYLAGNLHCHQPFSFRYGSLPEPMRKLPDSCETQSTHVGRAALTGNMQYDDITIN